MNEVILSEQHTTASQSDFNEISHKHNSEVKKNLFCCFIVDGLDAMWISTIKKVITLQVWSANNVASNLS